MSYYLCENEKCPKFGEKETIVRESFKYVSGLGLIGEHAKCPECGEIRNFVKPDADVPLSEKNIHIGEYSSRSVEEKREMLKKRSHEHFNKSIKERKEYLNNKAIGEMREINKSKQ